MDTCSSAVASRSAAENPAGLSWLESGRVQHAAISWYSPACFLASSRSAASSLHIEAECRSSTPRLDLLNYRCRLDADSPSNGMVRLKEMHAMQDPQHGAILKMLMVWQRIC